MGCTYTSRWYIDVRQPQTSEELSFDLSQHLPRRLAVGPVIVTTDNPPVFLSVIRKRLAKLVTEIERQRARTLDHLKRDSLTREATCLQAYRFTTKPLKRLSQADAFFITPPHVTSKLPPVKTAYVHAPLTKKQFLTLLKRVAVGGLVVIYGAWRAEYEYAMDEYTQML
jgi:hypothetical protein